MYKNKSALGVLLVAGMVCWLAGPANAQRITHSMGNFAYEMDRSNIWNTSAQPNYYGQGRWPADYHDYGNIGFYWNGRTVGEWVNADGETITDAAVNIWLTGNQDPPERGIVDYRKHTPPETVVELSDGTVVIGTPPFDGVVDPDLPSDQMVWHKFKQTSSPGFEIFQRVYSFANPDFADFTLHHVQYVLTFDTGSEDGAPEGLDTTQTIKDVWFSIGYMMMNQAATNMHQTIWYGGDEQHWSHQETVSSDLVPGGRDLLIGYSWHGNNPDQRTFESGGQQIDNTGAPRNQWRPGGAVIPTGEFTGSNYIGYTTLHVDFNGGPDLTNLPHSVKINASNEHLWQRNFPGYASWHEWMKSGDRDVVQNLAGYPNDPSQVPGNFHWKSYGPFEAEYGDTVNIVYALGVGGISREVAEEKGREWLAWYRGESGATFDDAAKNELIATGRDSLIQTLDRANWAWNNNMDVTSPIPAPNLIISEGPRRIDLQWDDMSLAHDGVEGYRIWRKRGEFFHATQDELIAVLTQRSDGNLWPDRDYIKWKVIDEVPPSQTSYEDHTAIRGEPYHYGVTVVDDGTRATGLSAGKVLESSRFSNRSQIPATPFEPGEAATDKIRIVPNPYFASAGDYNFSGDTNNLLIANLPPFAELRIFNAMGDLVKFIDHSSGTADEIWDQVTDFNQIVASGVYILHVSNARDIDGNPLPDAINKFVIVR
ncbi:MAG: hypothetical protein WD097_00425 [Balneolales bacterium]